MPREAFIQNHLLPALEGTTLSGRIIRFPADLPDRPLTLVVGFTQAAFSALLG